MRETKVIYKHTFKNWSNVPIELVRLTEDITDGDLRFCCHRCRYALESGDWAQDHGDHWLCEDCARP